MRLKKDLSQNKNKKLLKILLILLIISLVIIFLGYNYISRQLSFSSIFEQFDSLSYYKPDIIEMEVELEDGQLSYLASMDLSPTTTNKSFAFFALGNGLEIEKALLEGKEVRVWNFWLANFVYMPRKYRCDGFNLTLSYKGKPTSIFSKHSGGYYREDGVFLFAADLWIPFFAKGAELINVELRNDEGFRGVAAGINQETSEEDSFTVSRWHDIDYSSVLFHDYYHYNYSGLKDINIYLPPKNKELAPLIAEMSNEIMKEYENYFGTVDSNYVNITFIDKKSGAYYDSGLIILADSYLESLEKNENDENTYRVFAHEIGHKYFNYSDIKVANFEGNTWYVEGFAEYASLWLLGNRFGMRRYQDRLNKSIERLSKFEEFQSLNYYSYWHDSYLPYGKGAMMLEGLRRKEGDLAVLEFMNYVRKTDVSVKTIDCLSTSANKVFGNNYQEYFQYWLNEVEPLYINMEVVDKKDKQLSLKIEVDRELSLPLEIGVLYPRERLEIHNLEYSYNKDIYILDVEQNYLGVVLDPYRQLFTLYPQGEEKIFYFDLNHITIDKINALRENNSKKNQKANSINEILSITDKWVDINKRVGDWEVLYFLEDYEACWAIVKKKIVNDNYNHIYGDLQLTRERWNSDNPSIVFKEQNKEDDEELLLLKWKNYSNYVNGQYEFGGKLFKIVNRNNENDFIRFTTPVNLVSYPRISYQGEKLSYGDIIFELKELAFNRLETVLTVNMTSNSSLNIDYILGDNIKTSDNVELDFSTKSWRSIDGGYRYTYYINLYNSVSSLIYSFNSVVLKEAMGIQHMFLDGIELKAGEYLERRKDYKLPLEVKFGRLDLISFISNGQINRSKTSVGFSINQDNLFINFYSKKNQIIDCDIYLLDLGEDIPYHNLSEAAKKVFSVDIELEKDKEYSFPIDIKFKETGWYSLVTDITFNKSGRQIQKLGSLYVDELNNIELKESLAMERIIHFVDLIKQGDYEEAEVLLSDNYNHFIYKQIKDMFKENNNINLVFEEVKIEKDYRSHYFKYKIKLIHGNYHLSAYITIDMESSKINFQ
ncbi:MAG: hypothetical protein ACOCRO_04380 [Halanaerobiales bacterium]